MTRMKTRAPAISRGAEPASGPPARPVQSSQAIGTSIASEPRATMPIGMSRSSSASGSPPWRARLAAMAERMPPITGPAILIRVQIAATPITPAPKKRMSCRKTLFAHVLRAAGKRIVARSGSAAGSTSRCTMPSAIAAPTEMPTRWPTPIRAKERLPEMPVAPAPARNQIAASVATNLVWVRIAKPAETMLAQTRAARPLGALRLALARARADAQHLGRGHALPDRADRGIRRPGRGAAAPRRARPRCRPCR